jgi:hypothetical protein
MSVSHFVLSSVSDIFCCSFISPISLLCLRFQIFSLLRWNSVLKWIACFSILNLKNQQKALLDVELFYDKGLKYTLRYLKIYSMFMKGKRFNLVIAKSLIML